MAADSPRRTIRYGGLVVRPQSFSDKTVMESVVDFISDVVPQAYMTSSPKVEDKEKIQWAHFEKTDINDLLHNPDIQSCDEKTSPLLLILGYSNGVQIWNIMSSGEAQEVLSLRQGPIKIMRVLPAPEAVFGHLDLFKNKRPLIALSDSSSAGQPYCCVKMVSLKTGDEVHSISFKNLPVVSLECNRRVLVVVLQEKLAVFESCEFKTLFWVTSCYPCPGRNVTPVALGIRWLAYADKKLVPVHQSCGGMSGDGSQSYAATVISAAKSLTKGLTMFGESVVSSVTGNRPSSPKKTEPFTGVDNIYRPGIVTVLDVQNVQGEQMSVNDDIECDGIIAHFHAHANEPVASMTFDPSGTLLLTACKLGHNFHIFRVMAHPCSSSLGAVHHLYTLHRGDTTAKVIDLSFTLDSRWVSISTHRGTTHVYPITPYGGPVSVRTHCGPRVVNRASRFHKSAGIDEIDYSSAGRNSPVLSVSPSSSVNHETYPSLIRQNALNNNMGNPRLPPYPHPTTIYPLAQLKQSPLALSSISVAGPSVCTRSPPSDISDIGMCTSAVFGGSRGWVAGSPNLSIDRRESKQPTDSLFIISHSGLLIEYQMEPRIKSASATEKLSDDAPLDLSITGRVQWNLLRAKVSVELRPPLQNNNPLILASDAVITQQPTYYTDQPEPPLVTRHDSKDSLSSDHSGKDEMEEQWLSQVEIITHAGPHRRLWMGPQFSFKTYQNTQNMTVIHSNSSALLSQSPETHLSTMDIVSDECDLESLRIQPTRSSPVAMPSARPAYRRLSGSEQYSPSSGRSAAVTAGTLLIEAGSFDQSPNLCDVYGCWTESNHAQQPRGSCDEEEDRLRETLAEAMVESPTKIKAPLNSKQSAYMGSHETLSSSSGSAGSTRGSSGSETFASVVSRTIEHTLMFPSNGGGSSDT